VPVTLADGRTVQRMRYYASGTPQMPLTPGEVEEKFFDSAAHAVEQPAARRRSDCRGGRTGRDSGRSHG
jgi:hypothetical protein